MTEKQAEDLVRKNLEDYLKRMGHLPDNAGRYHCIDADHKDGNPSMTIINQGTLAKCWGHPGPLDTYNIFDAIGRFENIRTLHAQKRRAFEIYNIKIDEISKDKPDQKKKKPNDNQQGESVFLPSDKDTKITSARQKTQPAHIPVTAAPIHQEPDHPAAQAPALVSVKSAMPLVPEPEKPVFPKPAVVKPDAPPVPQPQEPVFPKPAVVKPDAPPVPQPQEPIFPKPVVVKPDASPVSIASRTDQSDPTNDLREILIDTTASSDNILEWEEKLLRSYNLDLQDQTLPDNKPAEATLKPAGDSEDRIVMEQPAEDAPAIAAAEPPIRPAEEAPAVIAVEPPIKSAEDAPAVGAAVIMATPAVAAVEPPIKPAEDAPAVSAAVIMATPAVAAVEPPIRTAEVASVYDLAVTATTKTANELEPESSIQPESLAAYQESHNPALYLKDYIAHAADLKNQPVISTGFGRLDQLLDGGLHVGLYVLCSRPAEGKTTFMLQMVDFIAARGQDVLLISLDQSRLEIAAKSLSRITLTRDAAAGKNHAKTARDIIDRSRYPSFSSADQALISIAMLEYSQSARCLYHCELNEEIGIQEIKAMLDRHIFITGRAPVLVIDSLQSLKPAESGQSEKANADQDVRALMRISSTCQIPILALSKVIRDDYVSDVILSLNMEPAAGTLAAPHRNEMEILKNRHGMTGGKIVFNFYATFSYFEVENDQDLSG